MLFFTVNESVLPWEDNCEQEINFPLPCPQMAVCNIGGQVNLLSFLNSQNIRYNSCSV